MKRFTVLASFIALVVFSGACKKNAVNTKNAAHTPAAQTALAGSSLEGEWELRKSQASLVPAVVYQPGEGEKLVFSGNDYSRYANGQLLKSGRFELVNDVTAAKETCLNIADGQFSMRIVFDNDQAAPKIFLQLSGGQLNFISGCFSVDAGVSKEYEKLTGQ